MRKRAPRSRLFEELPERLSTDLSAALKDRRKWKSFEGENASFVIALTRANWGKGSYRVCRSYVGSVSVPVGLHKFVRRYRVLHIRAVGNSIKANKVLTWIAFKKLLRLHNRAERVWDQLPSFVNTAVLKRTLAGVKGDIEDFQANH